MNKIILVGNICHKIELRYNQNNKAVLKNALAVRRDDENTDFINFVAFGKTAEIIAKYTDRGDKLGIEGNIRTGSYEKEGKKYYTSDVFVDKIELLGAKKEENKTTLVVDDVNRYGQLSAKTEINEDFNPELKITDEDINKTFDLPF